MQEINVNVEQKNGTVSFNFDEIKERLAAEMQVYKGMVFSESAKKEAKETIAELRKLKKAVDDKRKTVKTSFMQPYMDFEEKVKELNALIDEPISFIGKQVEEFEKKRVEERQELIHEIYEKQEEQLKEYLPLGKIYNPKWENATTTKKSITEEISAAFASVKKDLETIVAMESEFKDKGIAAYKCTLELSDAIQCIHGYEKQKQEILDRQAEKAEVQKREAEDAVKTEAFHDQKETVEAESGDTPAEFIKTQIIPPENDEAAVYAITADAFQIAQLESAMREYGIAYRRIR